MKLILTGYMGSGKSSIAHKIAQNTQLKHLDLDKIIEEKEKKSIKNIFESQGEIYFRKIEHQVFENILKTESNFVLATGGGTPCYYNNHLFLQNLDVTSVYLKTDLDTLINRLKPEIEHRPLFSQIKTDAQLKEFIAKHLFEREYYYNFSKYKIATHSKTIDSICEEILLLL